MRTVGVREFRDNATTLMAEGETLVIERRGKPIGFFVPVVAVDRRAGRAALGQVGDTVAEILKTTGLDEDALVAEVTRGRKR